MFDIQNNSLISKRVFIKKSGVSRATLNKRLQEDPNSPKAEQTPIGEMFIASEVNAWLSQYSPKMRQTSEVSKQAMEAAK